MKPIYFLNDYWNMMDSEKENGIYPDDPCDFISVHKRYDLEYRLLSPLSLIDESGKRPDFENETFKSLDSALKRAIQIAKDNTEKVNCIVICD